MGSVNFDQIYQTGVYVTENMSLHNFWQMGMHCTHLRTVPGHALHSLIGKKPAVWFEVPEFRPGA